MKENADFDGIVNCKDKTKKKKILFGCFEVDLLPSDIVFACLAVLGQVGMNVSTPLWIDSTIHDSPTKGNHSNSSVRLPAKNKTSSPNPFKPRVDSYFALSFSCLAFAIIFGVALLLKRIFQSGRHGETERHYPHRQLFVIGLCQAVNGVMVLFASSGARTPPYLQVILGNFMIPMVIGFRFLILRKIPTLRKFICAVVVLVSLFICLIPEIFTEIDPEAHDNFSGGQNGPGRYLWPLCFMIGYIPQAIMIVLGEKSLKMELMASRSRVSLESFMFWTSFYQFLVVVCFFWANLLPEFGYVDNIHHFWDNWSFGFKCFFGGAGCTSTSGVRGTMVILMYSIRYIGWTNLMRLSEGATLLAVVNALITPLGFIFWTLFREVPFGWCPEGRTTTWFSIGGLVPMVLAIFFYNTSDDGVIEMPAEQQPLLPGKNDDVLN